MEYIICDIVFDENLSNKNINEIENILIDFIKNQNDYTDETFQHTFLLNTYELSQNIEVNVIEKYVFEMSKSIIKEYNNKNKTNYSIEDFYIEFWGLKSNIWKGLHYDKDELDYQFGNRKNYDEPFLSSVSYFVDNNISPLILTELERPNLLEKSIETCQEECMEIKINKNDEHNMLLCFPRKHKQIIFKGGRYYHGLLQLEKDYDIDDRYILPVNFWLKENRPLLLTYFPYYSYLQWFVQNERGYSMNKVDKELLLPYLEFNEGIKSYNIVSLKSSSYNEKTLDINVSDSNKFDKWYIDLIRHKLPSFDFIKDTIYQEIAINKESFLFRLIFKNVENTHINYDHNEGILIN